MADISGFGIQVRIIASVTFPNGFTVTEFADDSDPFDFPSMPIAEAATDVNGNMIWWSKSGAIKLTLGIQPGSESAKNMGDLFEANRAEAGKKLAHDKITITAIYPSGRQVTLSEGVLTDGVPFDSVASAGRLKSLPYSFSFQSLTKSGG